MRAGEWRYPAMAGATLDQLFLLGPAVPRGLSRRLSRLSRGGPTASARPGGAPRVVPWLSRLSRGCPAVVPDER